MSITKFLNSIVLIVLGVFTSTSGAQPATLEHDRAAVVDQAFVTSKGEVDPTEPMPPTMRTSKQRAISLVRLLSGASRSDPRVAFMGGVNQFKTLIFTSDDVILVGTTVASNPRVRVDVLVAALKNAYQMTGFRGAPGCDISPDYTRSDPWETHIPTVFGMPSTVRLGFDFLAVDYRAKNWSAGYEQLLGIESSFDRRLKNACAQNVEVTEEHRLWFASHYYLGPGRRFQRRGQEVLIAHPINVQLEVRQRAATDHTVETQAAPSESAFATDVSSLLMKEVLPEQLATLRSDYRMIEISQIVRHERPEGSNIRDVLANYQFDTMPTPTELPGVVRTRNVTCPRETVGVTTGVDGSKITHYRQKIIVSKYRGGVDATVRVDDADFDKRTPDKRRISRILAGLPPNGDFIWSV